MDFFFNTLRKVLVSVVTLVFAFVVLYVPQNYELVKVAQAQFGPIPLPVMEVGPSGAANISTAAATATVAGKETILDGIAYHIAKAFISQMLRSTITWINSGFKGSPAFVQDLDRFLLDVADEAAGEYIKTLGELGSFICSPFRIDIQLALTLEYQKARENRREDSCTFSGIVDSIEDFYKGEVASDKFWEQWIEVTSKPKTYTPYGQLLEARAEMELRIINQKGQVLEMTAWADGFLSSEICESVDTPTGPKEECVISTPGKTISESLNKALGAGQDQLVAADEIDELIGALIGQIANQALTGAAGLLGLTVSGGGGGGSGNSYVDDAVNEQGQIYGSYLQQGIANMDDKLAVQIEYRDLANSYIPRFQTLLNNPRITVDKKATVQRALADAEYVRGVTIQHIAVLQPLVDSYDALENEYASATPARQEAIRSEQSTIVSKGVSYRAYTEDRLEASDRAWSEALNL
jgi:hypothetical protein